MCIRDRYEIEVDSSSSMFRIVHAVLTVKDGRMSAVLTLSGKGYGKLFPGTGEEAVNAPEDQYIPSVENEEGAYTCLLYTSIRRQMRRWWFTSSFTAII